MYEFIIGFVSGSLVYRYFPSKKTLKTDAQVQADELIIKTSEAIPIFSKKSKTFVPGELADFWSISRDKNYATSYE
jgi:hypothetical protein